MNVLRDYAQLQEILAPIISDENVQDMKNYIQHGSITTFEHCFSVAKLAYRMGNAVPFEVDMTILLQGAMLHDFYLYDWHELGDGSHRMHGFRHAKRAANNAVTLLGMNEDVHSVIYSHMWPLNPLRVPRSREAFIVCLADKCIALHETLFKR